MVYSAPLIPLILLHTLILVIVAVIRVVTISIPTLVVATTTLLVLPLIIIVRLSALLLMVLVFRMIIALTSHRPILVNFTCFVAHLVSNLTALLASTELSLWLEAIVPVDSDHPTVNLDLIQEFDSDCRVLSLCIFDKTKATILIGFFIKTHHQIYNNATLAKDLK